MLHVSLFHELINSWNDGLEKKGKMKVCYCQCPPSLTIFPLHLLAVCDCDLSTKTTSVVSWPSRPSEERREEPTRHEWKIVVVACHKGAQEEGSRNRKPEENVDSFAKPVGDRDQGVSVVPEAGVTGNRGNRNELCDGLTDMCILGPRRRATNSLSRAPNKNDTTARVRVAEFGLRRNCDHNVSTSLRQQLACP